MKGGLLAVLVAGMQATAWAQQPDHEAAGQSFVSIFTGHPVTSVLIDSIDRGPTPVVGLPLSPGRHQVRLAQGDPSDWYAFPLVDTITLAPAEHRTLHYLSDTTVLVSSVPTGALLRLDGHPQGTSPARLAVSSHLGAHLLTAELRGFLTDSLTLGNAPASLLLRLTPVPNPEGGAAGSPVWGGKGGKTPLFVTAAAGILTGVAAAYFKIKADKAQDRAITTGDPGFGTTVHRWDTLSAVFLVTSQACLGVFMYLLLQQ